MGVMSCNRHKCENVLSDHYSNQHGYLCTDCYNELLDGGPVDIEEFMKSSPGTSRTHINWYDVVRNEFPVSD